MKKVIIEKPWKECFSEAFENGAVITSNSLCEDEYIFVSNGVAYYEDGTRLDDFQGTVFFMNSMEWVHESKWSVIGYLTANEQRAVRRLNRVSRLSSEEYKHRMAEILELEVTVC